MENRYYELELVGCKRQLMIVNLNEKLAIAGFIILGDVELTEACAAELAKRVPEGTEAILTAEAKGIPLAESIARHLGMPYYVVARKNMKAYMKNPLWVEVESITTEGKQRLCLMDSDIERIRGKKVLLVDDVISTGESIRALEKLAEKAGGEVIGRMAALAEGDAAKRKDIIFLKELPLFEAE